jgi:hypothetical protein
VALPRRCSTESRVGGANTSINQPETLSSNGHQRHKLRIVAPLCYSTDAGPHAVILNQRIIRIPGNPTGSRFDADSQLDDLRRDTSQTGETRRNVLAGHPAGSCGRSTSPSHALVARSAGTAAFPRSGDRAGSRGKDAPRPLPSRQNDLPGRSASAGVKFAVDLYGAFPVKRLFWVVLTVFCSERERPFFVPSPAIRSPERAEGVKGPKR